MAVIWLWRDTAVTNARMAASHMEATFWYVLPSLPMFLLIPALMKRGVPIPGGAGGRLPADRGDLRRNDGSRTEVRPKP